MIKSRSGVTGRHKQDLQNDTTPGPWFNIKISSNQYRKSHCGDKTIIRSSYLHNGISYTGKTTSLYWIRAQYFLLNLHKGLWAPNLSTLFPHITVTSWWAWWRLKSPASRLFTQPFIQAQIKENIKAQWHWSLWWKFTGDWWIPRTKGQ